MTLSRKSLIGFAAGLFGLTGLSIAAYTAAQSTPPSLDLPNLFAQNSLNRLRIVFPSRAGATDLQRKANSVAQFLSRELKMPVEAIVADDTVAVEALRSNRAEVAFLSTRPGLKAKSLANASFYLAEVRSDYSGRYTYRSVFVVRNDSPLRTKGNSQQTLGQLRGKRMAFTSPTSGSGFIFPVGELVKQKFVPDRDRLGGFFGQVSYGGNYSGALQAVLRGQADVAAVSEYALKPPYVTAEESKRLRVLQAIPGVPAHGVAIDDRVPAVLRERLITAMQKLNQPANNAMLTGLYNSTELVRVDHDRHLAPMKDALRRVGMEP
ncbi:MAG: phosphate/phosphite/phosphonate ABC transporter substrate-binding protein [Leptolyngbyaceae cyanobacterium CSU_1_3]|nr:phosphate/phosphite/phosphonate ABC transporter substrate-binding protein [Leptolyngbyaceae cyanobacterium CSU_1_3]